MSSEAFLGPQNVPKLLTAGTSPQTRLGELTAGFKGPNSKGATSKSRGWKGREREGMGGAKMIYAPERQ